VSDEIVFDGSIITATTLGASDTVHLKGHTVSASDFARLLIINGGENFISGAYLVASADTSQNTWKLDHACTTDAGAGMTGRVPEKLTRPQEHMREFYDPKLPNQPSKGETRLLRYRAWPIALRRDFVGGCCRARSRCPRRSCSQPVSAILVPSLRGEGSL